MKTLAATRYVTPLREGGSLPAVVEAEDGQLYVLKFRGAGQGVKALVAEWIAGELARALELPVPPLVRLQVDAALGRNEKDPEIQDLLKASVGLNLGMGFLSGALGYDPLAPPPVEPQLASRIVWFDALVLNVDRGAKNPNLLLQEGRLWMIDHGAALYFHHAWADAPERARSPYAQVKLHVLLRQASALPAADEALRARLAAVDLEALLAEVPDEWLLPEPGIGGPEALRDAYVRWLRDRAAHSTPFLEEAARARAHLV